MNIRKLIKMNERNRKHIKIEIRKEKLRKIYMILMLRKSDLFHDTTVSVSFLDWDNFEIL